VNESYLKINGEYLFYRHNEIDINRPSLLFVHGLGDSSLSFEDAFKHPGLSSNYNIIVPDLIGYGRSSGAADLEHYRFDAHIQRLWALVKHLKLKQIILIGHSMGGDITTLMCESDSKSLIKKYISIEGDVTQHELFVSGKAVEADRQGNFKEWFYDDFMYKTIFKTYGRSRSSRLYFASLNFCRLDAFLENASELVERNTKLDGRFKSEIGEIYCSLHVPRIFCYGTLSCSKETLEFLAKNKMEVKAFEGAGHSPMIDKSDEFYDFLHACLND
jgi:pimeloyl-ACP methyl ester carboxylesterase